MKKINATPAKISTIRKRTVRGPVRGNYIFPNTDSPWLVGEEEKKSKGRMERSGMGWKEERFDGGVLSALCICFQDNTCMLPCYCRAQ